MTPNENLPLALITNDDGIQAAGVHRLIDYLSDICRIICVCPDRPRSGQSMAITVDSPLKVKRMPDYNGAEMYAVNGTPTDCVKLAMHTICPHTPDIVLSGINHGSNAAVNVVYSGTMGAAFEGAAFGLRSIGYSLTDHSPDADFSHCRGLIRAITRIVLAHEPLEGLCYNVNFPKTLIAPSHCRVVRSCRGKWTDEYADYTDPQGKPFYWLTGKFINLEPEAEDTDEWCLTHGVASVVPVLLDRTAPFETVADVVGKLDGLEP